MTFNFNDLVVEAQLGGAWVDVSGDVYQRDGLSVTRGIADESHTVRPTVGALTLDNRSGNYATRNPMGAYFGTFGRNTPVRISIRRGADNFNRTVANSWGTGSDGTAWDTELGLGAPVLVTDWAVTGTTATHSVPVTAGYRLDAQTSRLYGDVDVQATFSMSLASITGTGGVEPCNLIVRYDSATANYWFARVAIAPGGAITVVMADRANGVMGTPGSTGLTYAANTKYRVRAQIEGRTLRAKVWLASGVEPLAWHVIGTDSGTRPTAAYGQYSTRGGIGIRSGVASGNTNTLPIVFTYDDLEVRQCRMYGEASNWPASQDVTGRDSYIKLEVGGISRRLGASGTYPLRSALYRSTVSVAPLPVHYWPCEDGTTATGASNIMVPGAPLNVAVGTTTWATYTGFDCSAALPTFNKTDIWQAWTSGYALTGTTQIRMLAHIPKNGMADQTSIFNLYCTGTFGRFTLNYGTGGTLRLVGFSSTGATILDSGNITFNVDDHNVRLDVQLIENGSGGVDWKIASLAVGAPVGGYTTGTVASNTVGTAYSIVVNPDQSMQGVSVGHIMLHTTAVDLFAQSLQLAAYATETAPVRMARLAAEEGIELYATAGPYDDSGLQMGPQKPLTLLALLQECVDMDMGYLFEARSFLGYIYRRRVDLYDQLAMATVSYSGSELSPAWSGPVTDDQGVRNDITLTRLNGGTFRKTITSGVNSTAAPSAGGAGPYTASSTVNVQVDQQLPDVAGWQAAIGTQDRERYASVAIDRLNNHVQANAALLNGFFNLDTGLKVAVSNMSPLGLYDTAEQLVTGYTERMNRFEHNISFVCLPEEIYHIGVFDDGLSRWSPDNSTVNTGFNSSATSLLIDSVAGFPLWTTTVGDFPFDIMIGGERMTVTTITGASTPQTFTVTRAVNGVSKAHVANEKVTLFRPVYYGL